MGFTDNVGTLRTRFNLTFLPTLKRGGFSFAFFYYFRNSEKITPSLSTGSLLLLR